MQKVSLFTNQALGFLLLSLTFDDVALFLNKTL